MISVIIPVYNSSAYLDDCVKSVVNQTIQDWECILVDDGSSDGSGLKCDEWARKDNRISVIHQENKGVSIARNVGMENAHGDFLYFLDSDDWCTLSLFEQIGDADLFLGSYMVGEVNFVSTVKKTDNYPLAYLKDDIRVCIGSFFVRKSLVKRYKINFEPGRKYAEDLSFILRCLLYTSDVRIVDDVFMHYRQVEGSAVHTFDLRRFDAYFSRLWLLNDVLPMGNDGVNAFLHHNACIESIVLVTRELFAHGFSVQSVTDYYKKHPVMYITMIRAMRSRILRRDYARIAKLLVYCPLIYKCLVVCNYKWYDFRAYLGKIKYFFICR